MTDIEKLRAALVELFTLAAKVEAEEQKASWPATAAEHEHLRFLCEYDRTPCGGYR